MSLAGLDLAGLDLNLMVVFDRLMETSSVTEAARRLGLTQSTVSAALTRLRRHVVDRLLERQGNRMVPTRTALTIWPDIRQALSVIETSLRRGREFDPSKESAALRLGFDEYSLVVFGGSLIRRLRGAAPNVRIEILPGLPPRTEDELADGRLDLAIGAVWMPLPGLRVEMLGSEAFACVLDRSHPVGTNGWDLEQYLSFPHLLVSSVGLVAGNVDAALFRIGRERKVGATIPYLLAAPEVLAESDMILHVGRRLAARFAGWYPVRVIEPPLAIPGFTIAMVWHPRNTDSEPHRWLRDKVLEAAREFLSR